MALFGVLGDVANWIATHAEAAASHRTPTPTWVLVLGGLFLVLLMFVTDLRDAGHSQEPASLFGIDAAGGEDDSESPHESEESEPDALMPSDLTDREKRALRAFAKAREGALAARQLAQTTGKSRVWADAAIDNLKDRGLIQFYIKDDPGNVYRLTPQGRDLVLREGWT